MDILQNKGHNIRLRVDFQISVVKVIETIHTIQILPGQSSPARLLIAIRSTAPSLVMNDSERQTNLSPDVDQIAAAAPSRVIANNNGQQQGQTTNLTTMVQGRRRPVDRRVQVLKLLIKLRLLGMFVCWFSFTLFLSTSASIRVFYIFTTVRMFLFLHPEISCGYGGRPRDENVCF